jgi:CHRD domain
MSCLRTRILTFLNPAIVRSTVESTASFFLGACFLSVLLGATPPTTIQFRLSPGPRLVGTRADRSGAGTVTATLEGARLTLKGSFSGLLAIPTTAHLAMGPLPGVRGPTIANLTVSPDTNGTLSGTVELDSSQIAALHKGGLYVEIDSAKAPEGDLWGWIMPRRK